MDNLLKALAKVKTSRRFRCLIAGEGPDGDRLRRLARDLGIEDRVLFLGWMKPEQIRRILANVDIFVLGSRRDPQTGETEGTPTVLLEAQAAGLPVISTVHADIPFIVDNNKTGILVPENDIEALSNACQELIYNPSMRAQMGLQARRKVQLQHGSRRIGKMAEELYSKCETQRR
jgi:glycosyltransferase involved in cell wall biosynthesis